jgi:phosphatidate cytidylyltransferase
MNNFVKRTLSGIGFAAVMLAALLTNKFVFGFVMLLSLVVMMKEFLQMTCGSEYRCSQALSIFAGAVLFLLVFLYNGFNLPGRFIILAMVPVFVLMINSLYLKDKKDFHKFANLYTSILYIAVPWSLFNFAAFSADSQFNGVLLLSFFGIVWASDVGAYVFGITLGQKYGKKLFPSISPKKSWIGFWGGILTAVVVAVILHRCDILNFSMLHSMILAVLINIASVYGDLIESQWKRYYNVKDSSNLIPGHGGLLDRFDSALVAIPVGVIYLVVNNLL